MTGDELGRRRFARAAVVSAVVGLAGCGGPPGGGVDDVTVGPVETVTPTGAQTATPPRDGPPDTPEPTPAPTTHTPEPTTAPTTTTTTATATATTTDANVTTESGTDETATDS